MHRINHIILCSAIVCILLFINPVSAEDFIVKIGENKTFTEFNNHFTEFSNDPNNILPWPDVREKYSENNTARVSLAAAPNQAGCAEAETGVDFTWDLNGKSWEQVKNTPIRVTVVYSYEIQADWVDGYGSSDAQIFRSLNGTDVKIGYSQGGPGTISNVVQEIYEITPDQLGDRFLFLVYCHAHNDINGTAPAHTSHAQVVVDSIKIEFPEDVTPVILVHGWRGSPETWTVLEGNLSDAGFPYAIFDYSPGLEDPYIYAFDLRNFVNKYKSDNHYDKVDIVCHSMGALVSRVYMENLGGSKDVRQWIGVCPVNHGAAIADLQSPAYAYLNKFFNLQLFGNEPAVTEMKTTSRTVTYLGSKHDPNVIYRVIVGYNGEMNNGYLSFFGGYTLAKDQTGQAYWTNFGDGVVALEQSKLDWAGIDCYSGLDHNSAPKSPAVNQKIIEYLNDPSLDNSKYIPINEQRVDWVENVGSVSTGLVHPGGQKNVSFEVDKGAERIINRVDWPGSDLNLTLISPSGNPYQQLGYYKDNTSIWYEIDNPEEGNWTAQIDPIDIPENGEPYTLTGLLTSNLTFSAGTNRPDNIFHQHENAIILAELKNGISYVMYATVQMNTTDPDGLSSTSYLHDDGTNGDSISGDGIYSLSFMLDKLGIYQYGISAKNESVNIERETGLTVYSISPSPTMGYIIPASGYNGTTVTINDLHGSNFKPNSSVKLSKIGQNDIYADNVIVVSPGRINCNFTIPSDASLGTWDVTITTPEYQSATLYDAFSIIVPSLITQTKIAIFNNGTWYIDCNGDGQFNAGDINSWFGSAGSNPVIGDWNGDGCSEIGVFKDGAWLFDSDGSGTLTAGDKDFAFGGAGWTPVVGDWDANGIDEIGIYQDGVWLLDYDGSGGWSAADKNFAYGDTGWTPVVGDWDANGIDEIGIYQDGAWLLDYDTSWGWTPGDKNFGYGNAGFTPVVGDWNADGRIKIGIYQNGGWLIDYDGLWGWDASGSRNNGFGSPGWTPVVGKWHIGALYSA